MIGVKINCYVPCGKNAAQENQGQKTPERDGFGQESHLKPRTKADAPMRTITFKSKLSLILGSPSASHQPLHLHQTEFDHY